MWKRFIAWMAASGGYTRAGAGAGFAGLWGLTPAWTAWNLLWLAARKAISAQW